MRINEEIDALEVMGIRPITYLASTRIVAGVVAVIPIYTVAVLMSFLATRFGTTIIYGQSRGRLRPLLRHVPAADGSVVVLHRGVGDGGIAVMAIHTYYGYTVTGGPAGVGEAVGRAVRLSITAGVFILLTITLSVYGQSGNFHSRGDGAMTNSSDAGTSTPSVWAPVLLVGIAISTLTAMLFSGTLRSYEPLTLVSDRSGLVMEDGAKVKLRGVQVGEVTGIGAETGVAGDVSKLSLKIYPEPFKYLPNNLEAEIKSSTAFGAKYVDLIVPSTPASSGSAGVGGALTQCHRRGQHGVPKSAGNRPVHRSGETELDPVGVAEGARQGRSHREAITDSNNVLLAVNLRMETVRQDWQLFGRTTKAYSAAAQNIVSIWIRSRRPARLSAATRRRSTLCCCRRSASPTRASTRSAETN